MMKKLVVICNILFVLASCTKQTIIDTGICSPYHDCSIMDYLRKDDYLWGYTVKMIEYAGLTDLFEGKVDSLPEITFLGIPSMSVERLVYEYEVDSVSDLSRNKCRRILLQHVAKGKILKDSVDFRNMDYYINDPLQDGGTDVTMLYGNVVRFYREKSEYQGVPDAGPVMLNFWSLDEDHRIPISSADIQPLNGVVHALNYNYVLE